MLFQIQTCLLPTISHHNHSASPSIHLDIRNGTISRGANFDDTGLRFCMDLVRTVWCSLPRYTAWFDLMLRRKCLWSHRSIVGFATTLRHLQKRHQTWTTRSKFEVRTKIRYKRVRAHLYGVMFTAPVCKMDIERIILKDWQSSRRTIQRHFALSIGLK